MMLIKMSRTGFTGSNWFQTIYYCEGNVLVMKFPKSKLGKCICYMEHDHEQAWLDMTWVVFSHVYFVPRFGEHIVNSLEIQLQHKEEVRLPK